VLLALLGLALCAAAFLATRGAQDPGGAVTTAPAPSAAAPATPAEPTEPATKPAPQPAQKREAATPAAPAPRDTAKSATEAGVEAGTVAKALIVRKAVARGDAVVFFFTRPGAADDTGTRLGVEALHGVDRVTVIRAGLNELTAYRPVLAGAGVSQVPAVVVASAGQPARLLEGYVDGGTLRQTVADALR
jgi:hypothetical protein